MNEYFEYARRNKYFFEHNFRLWEACGGNLGICFDRNFLGDFCRIFPNQVMKTVRVKLGTAAKMLENPKYV
jgi:hypothetical protein